MQLKHQGLMESQPEYLKRAKESAPYLQTIFQQSIDTGWVSHDWKNTNIIAIHKKDKMDDHHVSMTSISCKELKNTVFHDDMDYLNKHILVAINMASERVGHAGQGYYQLLSY